MRRPFVAAASAALLTLMLVPVAGAATGTLDQQAPPGEGSYLVDWTLTQTFTAGLTGQLTEVDLYCVTDTGSDGPADVSVGSASTTGTCPGAGAAWAAFVFSSPLSITAGQQYTITFHDPTPTHWFEAAADYPGGAGADPENTEFSGDFAFRTWVLSTATAPPTTVVASERGSAQDPPAWLLPAGLASVAATLVVLRRRVAPSR
jgi:hypothetical protein